MRQVLQRPRDGSIATREVPEPQLRRGYVLVATRYSLISAGTERSKIEFGSESLFGKARARPDLVRKTVDRARVEGVASALAVARERLDALAPLGYSSAGSVVRIAEGVEGIAPGDRVACGGGEWATHAEIVAVPQNLVARVPDGVDLADAAYATVGAIALHGVRQSGAQLGERIGVVGLGLVGQLAARLLLAAGCDVFGIDPSPAAVSLAESAGCRASLRGAHSLDGAVRSATNGLGLDAVLICAATPSPDPLDLAVRLCRDRGRVVVVGDVPVSASRAALYEKEIELRLSRSYGPGRYDPDYEEHGHDLPPGYVRWTEKRNLQAFVDMVAAGRIDPSPLTTHRFAVEDALDAYAALARDGDNRAFGVLLEYPGAVPEPAAAPSPGRRPERAGAVRFGLIGAGVFARSTLLPALAAAGAAPVAVAGVTGFRAADVAARFGFERAAASAEEILADESIGAVVLATRHVTHASLAAAALRAGKAVFVEKPLALTAAELDDVEAALAHGGLLMVGFNRRFAPLVRRLLDELRGVGDRLVTVRVNGGPLAAQHWLHDPRIGGGRLLGEGCHFVDLLAHIAGSAPATVHALATPVIGRPLECSDQIAAVLRFRGGGIGSLVYTGDGDTRLAKERIEVFGGGLSAVLDDFRHLELYRGGRRTVVKAKQDKGHTAEVAAFVAAVSGRADPPSASSYLASTRATLALAESLRTGAPATV